MCFRVQIMALPVCAHPGVKADKHVQKVRCVCRKVHNRLFEDDVLRHQLQHKLPFLCAVRSVDTINAIRTIKKMSENMTKKICACQHRLGFNLSHFMYHNKGHRTNKNAK